MARDGGHLGAAALTSGQVALSGELLVGPHDDTTRDAEILGEHA